MVSWLADKEWRAFLKKNKNLPKEYHDVILYKMVREIGGTPDEMFHIALNIKWRTFLKENKNISPKYQDIILDEMVKELKAEFIQEEVNLNESN